MHLSVADLSNSYEKLTLDNRRCASSHGKAVAGAAPPLACALRDSRKMTRLNRYRKEGKGFVDATSDYGRIVWSCKEIERSATYLYIENIKGVNQY